MYHTYKKTFWGTTSQIKKFRRSWINTLRSALLRRGPKIDNSLYRLVGCDLATFEAHIEGFFQEGMNWKNMGKWRLDHLRPVESFEVGHAWSVCFDYRNLVPKWSSNYSKRIYSKEHETLWINHMRNCGFKGDLCLCFEEPTK